MSTSFFRAIAAPTRAGLLSIGTVFAFGAQFLHQNAMADEIDLGTANNFSVLASSTITSTGQTVINGGSVGLSPNTSITGFPPGIVDLPYTTYTSGAVALQARSDLIAAYDTAVGLAPTTTLTVSNLGGMTLTPGVYFFASSAQLTGTLTLNDQGNPDAVFVFQIGSTLTTASDSSVISINDPATPGISVFWQVGSSATLGTGTDFEGNILADTSITADTGATVEGRLLAENGAVTLDDTAITAPPAEMLAGGGSSAPGSSVPDAGGTLLLFGFGLATLCVCRKWCYSPS